MYYYHGTTLENAIKILEERVIKGKKGHQSHSNRYVVLTKSKSVARQRGEVLLRFDAEQIGEVLTVKYEDKNFTQEHPEVSTLILKGSPYTSPEDKASILKLSKANKEVVVFNKVKIKEEGIAVCLVDEDNEKLNELKEALQPYLTSNDKISKSKK